MTAKSETEKSVRVCVFWPANVISVLLGNDITFLLLNLSEVPLSAALIHVHRSLADTALISKSQIVLTKRRSPSANWVFLRQQTAFSGKFLVTMAVQARGLLVSNQWTRGWTQVHGWDECVFISLYSWLMDKQVWNVKNAFQ